MPLQLTKDDLLKANALIEAGAFLAILIGTIIGGLIITISSGILWFAAILISAAIIGFYSSLKIPRISVIDTVMLNFNIYKGISLILRGAQLDRSIWFSIICISWFWFIGAVFLTQFPIYTKNIIGGNEYVVTFFLTLFSIGIGVGSLICNKLLKGKISLTIVPIGAIGMTIAITVFYCASFFYQQLSPLDGLIEFMNFCQSRQLVFLLF